MAIFNQSSSVKRDTAPPASDSALKKEPDHENEASFAPRNTPPSPSPTPAPSTTANSAPRVAERELKESLIAADLTIEGKIEGAGHIRLAGRFKGDVQVKGDLTIEQGAKLTGGVRARKVIIAGELEGNIEAAERVELLESGMMVGDMKAGTVIVSSGSRMRGQVEFGFEDKPSGKSGDGKPDSDKS